MMMEYVENHTDIHDLLNIPDCPVDSRGYLNPNIDQTLLETLYGELASILLKLSAPSLPRIGSLTQVNDFTWEISRRPLSMNMNDLVGRGVLPRSALPDANTAFDTASSYLEVLAELNVKHLIHQRNDAVSSEDDCRRKFVARKLFLKLAKEKKLNDPKFENGPFKIWCDDLRPANVLVNEQMKIAAVLDWQFTYAAPVEYTYAPPWWLLLERPENWHKGKGFDDWTRVFDYRLKTFLRVMKEREDIAIEEGRLNEDPRLSISMEQSSKSGDFWIVYALSRSFAFDTVYWRKIDPRFFGPAERSAEEVWRERLGLLNAEEMAEMEELVAWKMTERKERVLKWDPDESTLAFWEEMNKRREVEEEENLDEEGNQAEEDETRQSEGEGLDEGEDIDCGALVDGIFDLGDKLATISLSDSAQWEPGPSAILAAARNSTAKQGEWKL